ncbi:MULTISPECIES: sensor histidine kinase KdpD [unclassified Lentimicrobium]|uniref:sensor histidine kinase n=1 Tax=unclassified Lentimicrobium TaxID=2677434 RepID=UPI001555C095|nr:MULTISPECIES: HAMP domain-containing sensor histidine kinase [unclassified Lentimicrobium]NPD45919.1 HAMP domain-containing histidine kinase [Lentimicrobium sp. S6]NPD85928.1 HAMP domain-containing histidine kinase [Lentimicrobium sp. L6]
MINENYVKTLEKRILDLEEELKFKDKEVDGLKGAFLANVSHEIRTPMNAIVGFSSLLKDPGFSPEEKNEFIDEITQASNHLTELIEDVIEVANLQFNKKSQSVKEVIDPYQLLFEIFEEYQYKKQALYKGEIEMRIKTNKDLLSKEFISNPRMLHKVLENLIDNAFKFTKEGSIELNIEFYDNYLEYVVSDTGIGIASDRLSTIYNNFSKVWKKNGEVLYEGLGIGLSSAKNFVDLLGGIIQVQSQEGKGTIFYVSVPYIFKDKPLELNDVETKNPSQYLSLGA